MQYSIASASFQCGCWEFERQIQFGFPCQEPQGGCHETQPYFGLPLVVFSLLLATTSAYSQSKSKAYVPFSFKAGQAQLLPVTTNSR